MSNTIESQVASYLASQDITVTPYFTRAATSDDGWEHDAFTVSLASASNNFSTSYMTGTGHRTTHRSRKAKMALSRALYPDTHIKTASKTANDMIAHIPAQASILSSLILDAQAGDMLFNDWCDDYGYDSDSISAFDTYQACCKTHAQLRTVFTQTQLAHLTTLTEEY